MPIRPSRPRTCWPESLQRRASNRTPRLLNVFGSRACTAPDPSPASKPSRPLRQLLWLNATFAACRSIPRQKLKKRVDTVASPAYITATSPDGGIGRRARFRSVCREAWRFESSSGHQFPVLDSFNCLKTFKKPGSPGFFVARISAPASSSATIARCPGLSGFPARHWRHALVFSGQSSPPPLPSIIAQMVSFPLAHGR